MNKNEFFNSALKENEIFKSENRFLKEQICYIKNESRSFCVIIPKKITKNIFKYENYFKMGKLGKSINIFQSEKIKFEKNYFFFLNKYKNFY